MPVAAPLIIGASAIGGAAIASSGAKSAAKTQAQAAQQANDTQLQIYQQQRADAEPWRQVGLQALAQMGSLYGFTVPGADQQPSASPANTPDMTAYNSYQQQLLEAQNRAKMPGIWGIKGRQDLATLQANPLAMPTAQPTQQPAAGGNALANPTAWLTQMPGYQFRLNQGLNAITGNAAARGMLNSGATLKGLTNYSQDYASSEFGNEWNRLAGLAGVGQTVNQSNNALAQNYANQVTNNNMNAANARASSYANNGQMWGNVLGGIGGMGANYLMGQANLNNVVAQSIANNPNLFS